MENFYIKEIRGTYFIPHVELDAETGRCEIAGESYLEDTVGFYAKIIDWLEEYIEKVGKAIYMNIKLSYFNTSSSRSILNMLDLLKEYQENGGTVKVSWYYYEDDIDMETEIDDYSLDTGLEIKKVQLPARKSKK